MKKNIEKNNKKIISENNNIPVENAVSIEIKRKRGRPKKTENNNLSELKNKKNNNNSEKNNLRSGKHNNINTCDDLKNNKNNSENNIIVQDNNQVKKRGRPKGSKNEHIRYDHDININSGSGDNAKIIRYTLALSDNDTHGDINDIIYVNSRIKHLYNTCIEYDIKPSVAALAKVFSITRMTLFNWLNGKTDKIKNTDCLYAIKNAYDDINVQYEFYMNTGKINPVAGIFLMKNNFGYKDSNEHIITTNDNNNVTVQDITERANLYD